MKNQEIYKRVKINWWIVIPFAGIYIWAIFANIRQWSNSPVDGSSLIIPALICIVVLMALGRFIVIVNDAFVIFKTDLLTPLKIPLTRIKEVTVGRTSFWHMQPENVSAYYYFDFTNTAVTIRLKNGKAYRITIKDAEQIKEEIEKRMLITKKDHE